MSYFCNQDTAKRACEWAEPAILQLMEQRVAKRTSLCIVVYDNRHRSSSDYPPCQSPIYTHLIGPHADDYRTYANDKALASRNLMHATRYMQKDAPYLLDVGDTALFGSAVSDDGGIVVAVSGVQPELDTLFANWVLQNIFTICRHLRELIEPLDIDRIGDERGKVMPDETIRKLWVGDQVWICFDTQEKTFSAYGVIADLPQGVDWVPVTVTRIVQGLASPQYRITAKKGQLHFLP